MLPAYLANMAPVFATKIFGSKLALPLDFNKTIKGKPILGKNKTWRGLVVGISIGILTIYLQRYLLDFEFFKKISLLNYLEINLILYGFLFGFGVILGDIIKSFFKRRVKIKPGGKWFPCDQLDFLGALILIHLVYVPSWPITILIIIISPFLPLLSNKIGYLLKIKKVAW